MSSELEQGKTSVFEKCLSAQRPQYESELNATNAIYKETMHRVVAGCFAGFDQAPQIAIPEQTIRLPIEAIRLLQLCEIWVSQATAQFRQHVGVHKPPLARNRLEMHRVSAPNVSQLSSVVVQSQIVLAEFQRDNVPTLETWFQARRALAVPKRLQTRFVAHKISESQIDERRVGAIDPINKHTALPNVAAVQKVPPQQCLRASRLPPPTTVCTTVVLNMAIGIHAASC